MLNQDPTYITTAVRASRKRIVEVSMRILDFRVPSENNPAYLGYISFCHRDLSYD